MNKLLTVKQVAEEILNCHPQTIYKNLYKIPHTRTLKNSIRFKKSDIAKYLEGKAVPPQFQYYSNVNFSLNFSDDIMPPDKITGGQNGMATAKSKSRLNLGIGAVYPRKFRCGVRWFFDYRDKNGKRVQRVIKHAQSQQEAIKALQEEIRRVFDDEYNLKRERGSMKFEALSEKYIELHAKVNKKGWKKADKIYLGCHLVPCFGEYEIAKINSEHIERYKKQRLEEGVKKSTVNRELSCLRLIFNKAISWGYLDESPMKDFKFFSEKDNFMERVLSVEEEKRLLENCASRAVRDFIVFGLNTGMRKSEILSLEWKNVSLEKRAILVTMTKSGRNREIPINDTLYSLLARLHSTNSNGRIVSLCECLLQLQEVC